VGHRLTVELAPHGQAPGDTAGVGAGGSWGELPVDALAANQVQVVSAGDPRRGKRPARGLWQARPVRDPGADPVVWVLERRFDEAPARTGAEVGEGSSSVPAWTVSYRVTGTGAIELPGGVRVPGDGWLRHSEDFFNTDERERLVVLRGDSGWVGLVDNDDTLRPALEDLYREAEPARYQTHIQDKTLYLTPVGIGQPVPVGPLPKDIDEHGLTWQSSRYSTQDCVNVTVIQRN